MFVIHLKFLNEFKGYIYEPIQLESLIDDPFYIVILRIKRTGYWYKTKTPPPIDTQEELFLDLLFG